MKTACTLVTVPAQSEQMSRAPELCLYESFMVLHSKKNIHKKDEKGEEDQKDQNT